MFADLHALAQSATLLIAVSAEGELLRVGVTPTNPEDKTKAHQLRPISLLGTPAELDADFGAALIAWQAPRKSLVEQAQAAAGEPDDDDDEGNDKSATNAKPKATAPKNDKAAGKPGPKKKGVTPASAPAAAPEHPATVTDAGADPSSAAAAEPEFALEPPPAEAPGTKVAAEDEAPSAPAATPVVDTKTLDLF